MEEILEILKSIQSDVAETKGIVSTLQKRKPASPLNYPAVGKGRCISQRLRGGLRDPEVRSAIVRLRLSGQRFSDIAAYLRGHWPGQPEKHVPISTCHRFWQNVRLGRLREYGIEPPIDL